MQDSAVPSSVSSCAAERAAPVSGLSWTYHPAHQSPKQALFAVVATVATSILAGAVAQSVSAGLLSQILLVLSLRGFFFPTRAVFDERGVSLRCFGLVARRRWGRLKRFRYDQHGGFLSTRARPSALDALTGLHLTWGENREQAVAFIERRMLSHDDLVSF